MESIENIWNRITSFSIDLDKVHSQLVYDPASPLLFNTGLFLLLFCGLICLYQIMRRWQTARLILIILFSLYFYYKSSAWYCLILIGVCISDFVLGRLLGKCTPKGAWAKTIVTANVVLNLGMLSYFKYFNLLFETFAGISGTHFDPLDIILPAGISFFTFRSISYIVDIYRGDIKPCDDFLAYTFYLTFFPPLLAGPVVRAKDMLPQIKMNPTASKAMTSEGLFLIMCGLVKKIVIADYISQNFVDRVFDNPSLYSGFENLLSIYGFSIQLYCDFSGYSDMAIGLALLLGYRFKENFRSPYKSQNPTEFWRRWHISLSSWLRDYLYIPLGGNRKGKTRQRVNLMTTMVLGGLWHGASWMYTIWGAWQGMLLIGHKWLTKLFPAPEHSKNASWRRALNVFVTLNLVALGFMFFRARSLESVGEMLTQIAYDFHPEIAAQFVESYLLIVLAIAGGFLLHFAPSRWNDHLKNHMERTPAVAQAFVLAIALIIIIQVRQSDIVPFVYLQY